MRVYAHASINGAVQLGSFYAVLQVPEKCNALPPSATEQGSSGKRLKVENQVVFRLKEI